MTDESRDTTARLRRELDELKARILEERAKREGHPGAPRFVLNDLQHRYQEKICERWTS
jgi:hypothetical protein